MIGTDTGEVRKVGNDASWQRLLSHLERSPTIEEDAVIDIGDARVLVFGMGRVGTIKEIEKECGE